MFDPTSGGNLTCNSGTTLSRHIPSRELSKISDLGKNNISSTVPWEKIIVFLAGNPLSNLHHSQNNESPNRLVPQGVPAEMMLLFIGAVNCFAGILQKEVDGIVGGKRW